jgi:hypothetical protein
VHLLCIDNVAAPEHWYSCTMCASNSPVSKLSEPVFGEM